MALRPAIAHSTVLVLLCCVVLMIVPHPALARGKISFPNRKSESEPLLDHAEPRNPESAAATLGGDHSKPRPRGWGMSLVPD